MIKVLHVLDHFLPVSSGYAIRTSYLLEAQRRILGTKPVILLAPQNGDASAPPMREWEGMPVYAAGKLTGPGARLPVVRELRNMSRLMAAIVDVARKEKPDVIHAHSPVLNAWPALWAGRRLGLPVIYEIRAFWEDAAVMHGTTTERSLRYGATRFIETAACRRADAVVTICGGLRDQIRERGIEDGRIFLVPNGVDPARFQPGADGGEQRRRLGIAPGDPLVGFIGTPYRYEGLSLLVDAVAHLAPEHPRLRCLIVGDGFDGELAELRSRAAERGVADRVLFAGRVPHETINSYYAAIDVLAYPRVRSRLLDLVTPLKILEAMALARPVVGSDVGGIREIVTDGENGRLFAAGRSEALAAALAALLADAPGRGRMAERGRKYIEDHRRWDTLIEGHRAAYRHVGARV